MKYLQFYTEHVNCYITKSWLSLLLGDHQSIEEKLTKCSSKMMSVIQQKKLMPTRMFNKKDQKKCKFWSFQDTSFSCEQ